ncbi:MAG TPA: 1,6-anhydro-N-acetylmuramyl-L-alanine amidase AmpD [Steroidobacteraceae bacterium]|nr:1,6-anhydro-N-acetylmuramyl-L-alanine amidase AmpD [Steroidobacteraceae bacterium]
MTKSSGTICNDARESAGRPPQGGGEAQDGPRTESSATTHSPRDALQIERATGLLAGVRQVLSPHFDARPKGVAPELIVVHGITLPPGEFGGPWIDHMFAGDLRPDAHPLLREHAALRVSAHAVIRRDGVITQYVPFSMRAWHAGVSEYQGRSACNDFSIGIELEGTDETPYTHAQYESLASLVGALLATYPTLSAGRIAGHSDIAPGRKTDPGPSFDWRRWRKLLEASS